MLQHSKADIKRAEFIYKNVKPNGENLESAMCLMAVAHISVFACVYMYMDIGVNAWFIYFCVM
jgi:hypothetical protein